MWTYITEIMFYIILYNFLMSIELIMDVKFGILILLNMAPSQKLVLAPGAVADPGFPVGSMDLLGGVWTPKLLNFVCRNKRIWTLGGVCQARPLDPSMRCHI